MDHKAGRYDDHVIALSLAVHGALERSGSFHLESSSYTKRYTAEPAGQVIDSKGTRFLGDGRYRTASGEDFYNPRGM